MTNLNLEQLSSLIEFVNENNQYNDEPDEIIFWNEISEALSLDYKSLLNQ